MSTQDSYVNNFIKYLNNFVLNIRDDDPLPVRAPSYKVTETEIDGQIIDIVNRYLNHRECPPYVRSYVANRVWSFMRNHGSHEKDQDGCDMVDHGNQTFEPMRLIQKTVSKANEVLVELQSSLSPEKIKGFPRYMPVTQYAIKNTRRKMEDRHVVIHDLNTLYGFEFDQPHSFYGVFDGHAGPDAAVYAAAHLHQYMVQNPIYETDPVFALKNAFHITDTNFVKKCKKEKLKGGTTAVVALVREKRLVVAWLGDSLALLVRKREPVHVVTAHKADDPGERERIEKLGGCVIEIQGTWRVLGQLAVSRAIGDAGYKPYLSSECDIKSLEIVGDEDFLILACDGLWDIVKPEQAVDIVYAYLQANEGDTDGVGRCLVEAARTLGSEDNITAVVVFLREVSQLMDEEQQRVDRGEVSKAVPLDFVEQIQKDNVVPPSMNNIFNPPPELASRMETTNTNGVDHINEAESQTIGMDSDSDEGVELRGTDDGYDAPPTIVMEELKVQAPTTVAPTAEEVDAALAELDSLPDGSCEADVDEDEDDEDEEWNYYKGSGENKNETPVSYDNVEPPTAFGETDRINMDYTNEAEPQHPDLVTCIQTDTSPSPPAPSSPRSVEGFVTSVDLNAPEENFGTSFPINPQLEQMNGIPVMDNPSGPFSVYVSNSPEPHSIEAPPTATSPIMDLGADAAPSEVINRMEQVLLEFDNVPQDDGPVDETSSVEIIHAQSMVEVLTPTDSAPYSPQEQGFPLIMTQSVTGELPDVHYEVGLHDVITPQQALDMTSENNVPDVVTFQPSEFASTEEEQTTSIQEEQTTSFKEVSDEGFNMQGSIIDALPEEEHLDQIINNHFEDQRYDIPVDVIPQFDCVPAPLSESSSHNLPLESPVNEFNILDTPPAELKFKSPVDILEEVVQEADIMYEHPVSIVEETILEEPLYESDSNYVEPEPYHYPEPSTPRIEDLEQFTMEQPAEPAPIIPSPIVEQTIIPQEIEPIMEEPSFQEIAPVVEETLVPEVVDLVSTSEEVIDSNEDAFMNEAVEETEVSPASVPVDTLIDHLSAMHMEEPTRVEPIVECPIVHKSPSPVPTKEHEASAKSVESPKEARKATPATRTTLSTSKAAPKPSPRTLAGSKAPITKPSTTVDLKSKRPTTAATSSAARTPRVSSAPPTKTRPAPSTTRPAASRAPTTARTTTTNTKPRSASATTKPTPRPIGSTVDTPRPTTTRPLPSRISTSASTAPKPRVSSTVGSTRPASAAKAPSSAKSSPTTSRAARTSTFRTTVTNSSSIPGSARTTTTTSNTTRTSLAGERVPLSTRAPATKRPTPSLAGVHKTSSATSRTTTTTTTSRTTLAKDTKNTNNRLLSTNKTGVPPRTASATSKVNSLNRTKAPVGTQAKGPTKTGLKTKEAPVKKEPVSKEVPTTNGEENKIAEENAVVEDTLKDKNGLLSPPDKTIELAIDDSSSNEIIVNGDH